MAAALPAVPQHWPHALLLICVAFLGKGCCHWWIFICFYLVCDPSPLLPAVALSRFCVLLNTFLHSDPLRCFRLTFTVPACPLLKSAVPPRTLVSLEWYLGPRVWLLGVFIVFSGYLFGPVKIIRAVLTSYGRSKWNLACIFLALLDLILVYLFFLCFVIKTLFPEAIAVTIFFFMLSHAEDSFRIIVESHEPTHGALACFL